MHDMRPLSSPVKGGYIASHTLDCNNNNNIITAIGSPGRFFAWRSGRSCCASLTSDIETWAGACASSLTAVLNHAQCGMGHMDGMMGP